MFIQEELGESEQLALMFRAVESARNGVVITDPRKEDNPIIYTNPAFTEITGYDAQEILGRNCRFLQGQDQEQAALCDLRKAIKERNAITTVLRNYRKDGRRFYNELTVSPVKDNQGEVIAFVGIQNDITARIEAEQRISDFYSVVSHELRTPIAKIKSSLSIIADGEAGEVADPVRRFVRISLNAADNLWKLLENILDFKKLESGKFRLLKQRLQLEQLIQSAVAEFEPVANGAAIKLQCKIEDSIVVNADGQRLVQVLENFLSNAVKFSPAGTIVTVTCKRAGIGFVRVEVGDCGAGIDPADMNKLFEKFQQIESPDNRGRGGSGLGLAVCKAIIEAHGGSVGASSEIGKGSTFWFELVIAE
jgi:PAS domain S-box-containing protein